MKNKVKSRSDKKYIEVGTEVETGNIFIAVPEENIVYLESALEKRKKAAIVLNRKNLVSLLEMFAEQFNDEDELNEVFCKMQIAWEDSFKY